MKKNLIRLLFLISCFGFAFIAVCDVPQKLPLIFLCSAMAGIFVGITLMRKPTKLTRELNANVAEAQKILVDSLRQRGLSSETTVSQHVERPTVIEVLQSPMSYVLLIGVGLILGFHPDSILVKSDLACTVPSMKSLALVVGQYFCFVVAASGIYLAIFSKEKA